jgi:hypothetical protein
VWRPAWGNRTEPTETPEPARELSEGELLEATARAIVDRGLAALAIFLLESSKPLSFVASQGLVFLGPFVDAILSVPNYDAFCRMMENRENVEKLLQRIEQLADERELAREREKEEARRTGETGKHGTQ